MIFFFGTRTANLGTFENKQAICQSCHQQGSMLMHFYRRHFHIFWVPIFPLKKTGVTQCLHCKNVLTPSEMSDSVRNEFNRVKSEVKGPLWQYIGLMVIAFSVFSMIIAIIMSR